jgi:putative acetyltransferase
VSPPGLVVRATSRLDAVDLNALANLPGVRWGTTLLPHAKLEDTERWLSQSAGEFGLVAELEGRVVGQAEWHRLGGRTGHVAELGMMVHDDHTGRGIGRALLDALVEAAFDWHDLRRLQLHVLHDNAAAIRLYGRAGFTQEGRLRGHVFRRGRDEDVLVMARRRGES